MTSVNAVGRILANLTIYIDFAPQREAQLVHYAESFGYHWTGGTLSCGLGSLKRGMDFYADEFCDLPECTCQARDDYEKHMTGLFRSEMALSDLHVLLTDHRD